MKILSFILILASFSASAGCPDIPNSKLNQDQINVKNLLDSAYQNKNNGTPKDNLIEFTDLMKDSFQSAAEDLNESEISSFIVEQDNDNNICQNGTYISSKQFTSLISSKIIDTYYGCGCEH